MSDRIVTIAVAALIVVTLAAVVFAGTPKPPVAAAKPVAAKTTKGGDRAGIRRLDLSEAEWQARLTPEQFHILRQEGTERAFTGMYWQNNAAGIYVCAGCGLELFASEQKFESGTGWPSFWAPIDPGHVKVVEGSMWGMTVEEIECARCGGHQGHVFADGPKPTGLRYCINSASLAFQPAKSEAAAKK